MAGHDGNIVALERSAVQRLDSYLSQQGERTVDGFLEHTFNPLVVLHPHHDMRLTVACKSGNRGMFHFSYA